MVTNIHEAKTHFSKLVERAEAGEEIVIGRAGKPVAKLVPFEQQSADRRPGLLRGQVWMSADFDVTPDDVLARFEGGSEPQR